MTRKLEVRLLNYFLLIAIAAIMIGVEFYFEMNRTDLNQELITTIEQSVTHEHAGDTISTINPVIKNLRDKIVTMLGVLTLVVAIVMMMFIKNITMPLCKMAEVAEHINQGDLSQVIEVENKDEIGQVGIAINELTSNLQEVASFTSSTSTEAIEKLDMVIDMLTNGTPPDIPAIEAVKADIVSLKEFADSFELLQTDISS